MTVFPLSYSKKYICLCPHNEGVCGGSGRTAPLILNLGTKWVGGQVQAPTDLLPGKEPPVSSEHEPGWDPKPALEFWTREKFLAPTEN